MRKICLISALALLMASPQPAAAGAPAWEIVASAEDYAFSTGKIEVEAKDGYIYVTTPRPVTVKVLSIVGRLISEKRLGAGVARIKIGTRGIYILQAGDVTLRVAI